MSLRRYNKPIRSGYKECVQPCVQINNRSRKPPIYQYLCVRGFVRIPSRAVIKQKGYPNGYPFLLYSSPILDSKFECLRFAPVRAYRGPLDLVRRLALNINFRIAHTHKAELPM